MILEIILLFLIFIYVFWNDRKPKDYPPGPWGLPVIGDVTHLDMITAKEVKRLSEIYGSVFSIRVGSRLLVFMTDVEIIKTAFNKPEMQARPNFFTFQLFNYFENIGVVNSDGRVWDNSRRFILRHLRDLGLGKSRIQDIVLKEASELNSYFEKHAGKPLELTAELNVAVLNVIWQLVADRRFSVDDEQMMFFTNLVKDTLEAIQGPIAIMNILPWLESVLPTYIQNKLFDVDRLLGERNKLSKYLKVIIEEHKDALDPDNPRDYIDFYLLEMEKEKNNPNTTFRSDYLDLIGNLTDLFAGGSETTSTSFRWMILLLAKHPEEQRKAQNLIDEVVPKDRQPTLEDRQHMIYLDAIMFEVLRFSSFAAQGFAHAAATSTTLSGYRIPKGAVLIGCHEQCHRDSRYFDDPNTFNPQRFIGKDGELLTKVKGYAPFSIGRRQCLGESLAKAELYLFTSTVLQKFNVIPAPGENLDLQSDPTKPLFNFVKPYKVIFEKR